jgi:hypothetical protein
MKQLYRIDLGYGRIKTTVLSCPIIKTTAKQYQVKEYANQDYVARVDKDAVDQSGSKWHSTPEGAISRAVAYRQKLIAQREKEIASLRLQIDEINALAQ